METVYASLLPGLWIAWSLYWWIASRGVKQWVRLESIGSRLAHVVPLGITAYLLAAPRLPGDVMSGHFMPSGAAFYFAGAAITAIGLAFSVWARLHLGRNWSGMVTLKADHELIRSGPYRWARHPIYTGLLVAVVGSAMARGEWRGLLAVLIAFLALWRKSRLEERWMVEQFGEQYLLYRSEVSALIPYLF